LFVTCKLRGRNSKRRNERKRKWEGPARREKRKGEKTKSGKSKLSSRSSLDELP